MIATIQPGREGTASTEVDGPIPSTFSTTRVILKVHTPASCIGHKNQFVFCGNDPVNFVDPYGLSFEKPGFWGSLIPVVGSWRSMAHHVYEGNYGWATVHAVEFVADVTLVGGAIKAAGVALGKAGFKGLFKGGVRTLGMHGKEFFRIFSDRWSIHVGRHKLPIQDLARWIGRNKAGAVRGSKDFLHIGAQVGKKKWHYVVNQWRTYMYGGAYIALKLARATDNEANSGSAK